MSAPQFPAAPGPGWWLASDGRWYPPHLHPSVTAAPAPVIPTLAQPGATGGWPAALPGAMGAWPAAQPAVPPAMQPMAGVPSRRRTRTIPLLVGLVVALVAVEVGLVVTSSGTSASAAVADAVQTTLAEHTANFTVTGSEDADGTDLPIHATGAVNFSTSRMQLSFSVSVLGQTETVQAVTSGGTMYEQIPELSQLVPGKSWASIDLSGLTGTVGGASEEAAGLGNVSAELKLLALQGDQVRGLGTSTVDGATVQGYSVTVTRAAITRAIQNSALPQWIRTYSSELTDANGQQTLYVNSDNQLVKETVQLNQTVAGTSSTTSFTYQYSAFGAPVSISVPPASEVVSLQQLEQAAMAQAGQGSGGTGSANLGSEALGPAGAGSCPAGGAPQMS